MDITSKLYTQALAAFRKAIAAKRETLEMLYAKYDDGEGESLLVISENEEVTSLRKEIELLETEQAKLTAGR